MYENLYEDIEDKIIANLTDVNEIILESRLDNNAFTMTSTQIDKIDQEIFDEMFEKINEYENNEYNISTGAIEVLNDGWYSYVFTYQDNKEQEWKDKKNFVENILKYQHQIAEYLITLARNKKTVSYPNFKKELLHLTENNLDIFAKSRIAWDIVEFVCHDLRGEEKLNLSSLIITNKGIPADGYFDVMKTWSVYNSETLSKYDFHCLHLEKIYDYYQNYEFF